VLRTNIDDELQIILGMVFLKELSQQLHGMPEETHEDLLLEFRSYPSRYRFPFLLGMSLVSISVRVLAILTAVLLSFPQALKLNDGIDFQARHYCFFPHNSEVATILPFEAIAP
jgi:hypothetical protein